MATATTSKTSSKASPEKKAPAAAQKARATATPDSTKSAPSTALKPAVVAGAEMRKRELIDKVVERSDVRKKFAKPVVEAMIEILGETIAEGRDMILQPLGKFMIQRSKDAGNARITIAKIRQSKLAGTASGGTAARVNTSPKETVADPVE